MPPGSQPVRRPRSFWRQPTPTYTRQSACIPGSPAARPMTYPPHFAAMRQSPPAAASRRPSRSSPPGAAGRLRKVKTSARASAAQFMPARGAKPTVHSPAESPNFSAFESGAGERRLSAGRRWIRTLGPSSNSSGAMWAIDPASRPRATHAKRWSQATAQAYLLRLRFNAVNGFNEFRARWKPSKTLRKDQARSKRSRFITLVHAATKSFTNFSFASAHA